MRVIDVSGFCGVVSTQFPEGNRGLFGRTTHERNHGALLKIKMAGSSAITAAGDDRFSRNAEIVWICDKYVPVGFMEGRERALRLEPCW